MGRSLYDAANTQETNVEQTLAGQTESQVNLLNKTDDSQPRDSMFKKLAEGSGDSPMQREMAPKQAALPERSELPDVFQQQRSGRMALQALSSLASDETAQGAAGQD